MIHSKAFLNFLIISLLFAACHNSPAGESNLDIKNPKDSIVSSIIERLNLPYPEDLKLDSNSLIFCGNRTFDTSFLVHFKKQKNKINGTYYEVLPDYHTNLNDVRTPDNQILFFEGYSFILDSMKWETIKRTAEKLPPTDTSKKNNPPVLDGNHYFLCFNFNTNESNPYSNEQYESFYKFLKDSLIENFNKKRVPIMHRLK